MSRAIRVPLAAALAAWFLALACVFTSPLATPSALPSATPSLRHSATPGTALARELGATPTPPDLEACAARTAQFLENAPFVIGFDDLQDVYRLVLYQVSLDALTQPDYGFAPETLRGYQGDSARHQQIWQMVVGLFPDEQRRRIGSLLIYTDGAGESLAAVRQTGSPYTWSLAVDIEDAVDDGVLVISLVHELAHLITLNNFQVAPDAGLFEHPGDEGLRSQGRAACENYFTEVGCSRPDSYINDFFQRFWSGIYDPWLEAVSARTPSAYRRNLEKLYDEHPGEFVSLYAVSSPDEDIAESFLYFALSAAPAGDAVAEQKVRFFADFPALVETRAGILEYLCGPGWP